MSVEQRHYKITKVGVAPDANLEASDWNEYIHGTDQNNGKSIPVDYTIKGHSLYELAEKSCFVIARYERNGEEKFGYMQGTHIQSIEKLEGENLLITTTNSVYLFERLEDCPPKLHVENKC